MMTGSRSWSAGLVFVATLVVPAGAQDAAQARGFDVPTWAFPNTARDVVAPKPPFDSVVALRVPRSARSFTLAQVKNQLNPPDWFPASHAQAPDVVIHSRPAAKYACGFCHLPDGQGRSENATIVGLPVEYFIRQVEDMASGARHSAVTGWGPSTRMGEIAQATTHEEAVEAARYFGRMRAKARYRVVEGSTIPKTYEASGLYAARPGTDSEPLANRLIEMSTDIERHEQRDAGETFIAFVPPGSIAHGRRIAVRAPATAVTRCATCHGAGLKGAGAVPPLAGRSPAYILRQLIGFRTGARASATSAKMQLVARELALDDMIAVAAYAGSRAP